MFDPRSLPPPYGTNPLISQNMPFQKGNIRTPNPNPLAPFPAGHPAENITGNPAATPGRTQQYPGGEQLTPEALQQSAALLQQNPQFQQQMAQLQALINSGQVSPEILGQMMTGAAPLTSLSGGVPPNPPNIGKILKTGVISAGLGIGLGALVDYITNAIYSKDKETPIKRILKGIDNLPGVSRLNYLLEGRIDKARKLAHNRMLSHESALLRMEGAYSPEAALRNYMSTYVGPGGHFSKELRNLKSKGLPDRVSEYIKNAQSPREIRQVLSPDLINFLPEEGENIAKSLFKESFWKSRVSDPSRNFLSRVLPDGMIKHQAPALLTMRDLDRLVDKELFLKLLNSEVSNKRLSIKRADEIRRLFEGSYSYTSETAKRFVQDMVNLLKNPDYTNVKRLLGLSHLNGNITSEIIQNAIKTKSGGRKAVWQAIAEAGTKLLSEQPANPASMTVEHMKNHLQNHHFLNRNSKKKLGEELKTLLGCFLQRAEKFQNDCIPLIAGENTIYHAVKDEFRPIGRAIAKFGYYLQRTFNGAPLKRIGFIGKKFLDTTSNSPPLFGRLLFGLLLFAPAISILHKSPKESKVANFVDSLVLGLTGALGFEVGQHLVHNLGLVTRFPIMRRLYVKPIPGINRLFKRFQPTWGSILADWVFPILVGSLFSYVTGKITKPIFGDPEKIEKKLQFEEDKKIQLQSQQGILQRAADGSLSTAQGIPMSPNPLQNTDPILSPETVGLTPERVAFNPMSSRDEGDSYSVGDDLKNFDKVIWNQVSH